MMGRSPCCDKVGLKKGPWTPEEDQKLLAYIEEQGHGSWRALPAKAGLQRCGKSCRLRWTNYLRPDIKRGKFSLQEEQTIIQLHALLGNRWSAIATHLPKRTDNEIKNYWNTHLKKRLAKMGIDPVTHKPKNDLLSTDGTQSKNAANLSHMAQWESARLEAEARLVRESKLRTHLHYHSLQHHHQLNGSTAGSAQLMPSRNNNMDVFKQATWNGGWSKSTSAASNGGTVPLPPSNGVPGDLESPTSTLTFSENVPPLMAARVVGSGGESSRRVMIEFVGSSSTSSDTGMIKEEGEQDWNNSRNNNTNSYEEGMDNSLSFTSGLHDMSSKSIGGTTWTSESLRTNTTTTTTATTSSNNIDNYQVDIGGSSNNVIAEEGFTNLLLNNSDDRSLSEGGGGGGCDSENGSGGGSGSEDHYQDNENYWNSILNLVNSSPSDSPMF